MAERGNYELDQRAFQKPDTMQCWWLALLEIARATGKLDPIFRSTDGRLYGYYVTGRRTVPNGGQLPAGVNRQDARFSSMAKTDTAWDTLRMALVYGPQWQRMIMCFLWDKSQNCPWKYSNDTVMTSMRAAELGKLLGYLGVGGIAFGTERTPFSETVTSRVNELQVDQRILVDKKDHAMSGVVMATQDKRTLANNEIQVFNQATGATFVCGVQRAADGRFQLKSVSGPTVIKWFLPLIVI